MPDTREKPIQDSGPLPVGLYLVGTPIGNLGDITLRALDTLRRVAVILAEDTRRTGVLLRHYQLQTRLLSCHAHNEAARKGTLDALLTEGRAVALVTEAGMPGVSDPGARIVAACRAAGWPVRVVPGPCAVSSAIALSGFAGAGYAFGGFLPRKSGARRRRIEALTAGKDPVVLFESPYRLLHLLEELKELLPGRRLCVCREMTKHYEEVMLGTAEELLQAWGTRRVRGEITMVISPPTKDRGGAPASDPND